MHKSGPSTLAVFSFLPQISWLLPQAICEVAYIYGSLSLLPLVSLTTKYRYSQVYFLSCSTWNPSFDHKVIYYLTTKKKFSISKLISDGVEKKFLLLTIISLLPLTIRLTHHLLPTSEASMSLHLRFMFAVLNSVSLHSTVLPSLWWETLPCSISSHLVTEFI